MAELIDEVAAQLKELLAGHNGSMPALEALSVLAEKGLDRDEISMALAYLLSSREIALGEDHILTVPTAA